MDEISTWVGKTAGWCIVISYVHDRLELACATCAWRDRSAFDASYMVYGTLFMLAGAYTLSRNGHLRGDFLYRAWSPRRQAKIGPGALFPVLFPRHVAFIYAGTATPASWMMNDTRPPAPLGTASL